MYTVAFEANGPYRKTKLCRTIYSPAPTLESGMSNYTQHVESPTVFPFSLTLGGDPVPAPSQSNRILPGAPFSHILTVLLCPPRHNGLG